jgi:glycosyltransferase involved in cell wall biosynthesis
MTTGKTFWFINSYASTPKTGMGGRHFYLAQELAKMGHKVYVIASSTHHLHRVRPQCDKKIQIEKISPGFNFVWVNGINYPEAHSKKRVLNWFLFSWRLHHLSKALPEKPDAILCSSPSIFSFLGAEWLAKRYKAKLLFEVRDIWPLTLTEVGGNSPNHPLIRLMQWIEDRAYRKSNRVVSNLKNAVEHMVQHGMDRHKFAWIPNGFSLSEVSQNVPLSPKVAQKIPQGKFIVGYTGTLGVSNAMSTLIEAAEILKENADIAFVIVGCGKEKSSLEEAVRSKILKNVVFIDPIPKSQIQSMLQRFDACFIGWLKEDLYRFGIGANKIPEYLFSGKPIVHAYSGACDPVVEFQAGLVTEAENPKILAQAILHLQKMPSAERQALGANGRKAALVNYEYGQLAKNLAGVLI